MSIFVWLTLLVPQPAFSRNPSTSPTSSLGQIADKFAQELPANDLKLVVFDFAAPNNRRLPLGVYLADEFSASLAIHAGPFTLIDRKQLLEVSDSMHLPADKALDYPTSIKLAEAIGANYIVRGSYGEFKGSLGITVYAQSLDKMKGLLASVNGKISVSPEIAQRLNMQTESLGSLPAEGQAGVTYVTCVKCPAATYSAAAKAAQLEGYVNLSAIITPEGRATNIKVVKSIGMGLDEKAVEAVNKWRFAPALDPDGSPIAVMQIIEVDFRLH
jgi:TonB family protein